MTFLIPLLILSNALPYINLLILALIFSTLFNARLQPSQLIRAGPGFSTAHEELVDSAVAAWYRCRFLIFRPVGKDSKGKFEGRKGKSEQGEERKNIVHLKQTSALQKPINPSSLLASSRSSSSTSSSSRSNHAKRIAQNNYITYNLKVQPPFVLFSSYACFPSRNPFLPRGSASSDTLR
jgi:hypothetical protein